MKTNFDDRTETDRVREHTAPQVLRQIDATTADHVRHYSSQPRHVIERRIDRLDREWDVERVLETNASILALSGLVLGVTVNRRWLFLTGTVLGFLLQHAVQGWCPPLPILRRLGVRTQREIDRERFALKVLQGDLDHLIDQRLRAEP
jgi:hypothetical protein